MLKAFDLKQRTNKIMLHKCKFLIDSDLILD